MRVPARLGWPVYFAVCVSGYLLYAVLAARLDPNARPQWTIDRAAAIKAVRAYAFEQGAEVSPAEGWWSRWRTERVRGEGHEEDVARYLKAHPGPAEELLKRLVPGLRAHAQLMTPEGDLFDVWLDPEGREVGFRRRFPDQPSPGAGPEGPEDESDGDAGRERAVEIARSALLGLVEPPGALRFELEEAEVERSLPGPPIYVHSWEGRGDELPELTVEAVTEVRRGTLIRRQLDLEAEATDGGPWRTAIGFALVILMLLALVYTTVRLVRRAKEGEVSKSRGFVLGVVVLVLTALSPWIEDGELSQSNVLLSLLGMAFNGAFLALALAFFWIALEGDVREAFPAKLTALDTLLSGRLLSRDVAWSSLVGVAAAGPALGLQQTARLVPGSGSGVAGELANAFSASAPLAATFARPLVLWVGVLVFLPLSFLLRWNLSPKRALVLLVIGVPALSLALSQVDPDTDAGEAAYIVAATAFILLPFFFHDLLAALFTTYALAVAPRILYLCRQPSESLRGDGLAAAALAGLGLVAILAVLARGRTYSAEEVRPVYARNLAERLELLAEKELAEQAYLRLLPSALPETPGVTLAASRDRGKAGGGKLYDFLALPGHRLGIAMIDLGGHGAAVALRLALLKGLLRTCGRRRASPRDVLESLQSRLSASGGTETDRFGGVYAVYDPPHRKLRFARRGESAALYLRRAAGEVVTLGQDGSDDELTLNPGDAVILASGFAGDSAAPSEASAFSRLEGASAEALLGSMRRLPAVDSEAGDRALVVLSVAAAGPGGRG